MKKLLIAFVLSAALSACGTKTIYVPLHSTKIELRDVQLRDSIYLRDSVLVRMANDTVWMEKYKTVYKNRIVRDSVLVRDSIQVPYPLLQVEEKRVYPLWLILPAMLGCAMLGWGAYRLVGKLY